MQYWLVKSEPTTFSYADLQSREREPWDGVRNYQARNFLRQMQPGDRLLFYHSNCRDKGVVGTAEVLSEAYPDHTAFDPQSPYHDPRTSKDNPKWYMVDVCAREPFEQTVGLQQIKADPRLAEMPLVQRGSRLSVMPVQESEYRIICQMGGLHER